MEAGEGRLPEGSAASFIRRSAAYGSRLGLERVRRLCALAGDPQGMLRTVHVAGTNGKGSTSAMLASIFSAAGYRTGLYTSPYIEDIGECLSIDGNPISSQEIEAVASELREHAERMETEGDPPTQFEIETAMAFLWFQKSLCDAAVIETGLGGRLDATNVMRLPLASVITSISLDHTAILGDTLEKIAFEKCGIIKPGGLTVCYPLQSEAAMSVIRRRAGEEGNPLFVPDLSGIQILSSGLDGTDVRFHALELHIPFVGAHQVHNAATAVQAALALRESGRLDLPDACIAEGVRAARLPLRQEVLRRSPVVLMDGAHNPDGLAALADTIRSRLSGMRTAVVMGMLADKDYEGSAALIAPLCGRFIAASPESPRALPASMLAEAARRHCADVAEAGDYLDALADALRYAGKDGAVVVCGSFYLAGPMRMVYYSHAEYLEQLTR